MLECPSSSRKKTVLKKSERRKCRGSMPPNLRVSNQNHLPSAEAAFKDFGVTWGFSAAVNASLDTIGKYSKVTIDKMSFGELSSQIQIPSNPTNLQDEDSNFKDRLNDIKREADEFWDKANNQKAKL